LGINRGPSGERIISVGAKRMPDFVDGHQTIGTRFGAVSYLGSMWYVASEVMPTGKAIALQVLVPSYVPRGEPIVCHISSAAPFLLCIDGDGEYVVTRSGQRVAAVGLKYQLPSGAYEVLVRESEGQKRP